MTEESPFRPADVYGLSKVVAEDVARFHADVHAMNTVALRLGMFVPQTFERYGVRLLFGGMDDRDVGHAVALALTHEPLDHFAAFNIMADSGLTDDDVSDLDADVTTALEQRWPGVTDLARERGFDLRESV